MEMVSKGEKGEKHNNILLIDPCQLSITKTPPDQWIDVDDCSVVCSGSTYWHVPLPPKVSK